MAKQLNSFDWFIAIAFALVAALFLHAAVVSIRIEQQHKPSPYVRYK